MAAGTIVVDCARLGRPDVATVDAIARLTLAARQGGLGLSYENAPPSLLGLLEFCGLSELLGIEPGRQAEEREDPRRVEEERDLGDTAL